MRILNYKHLFTIVLALLLANTSIWAQSKDPIERLWLSQEKNAKINIYKGQDGKFYGKIAWIREPLENGQPKMDKNNPNKDLRQQPLMGLVLLKGFKKAHGTTYEDGEIYDPKNGKTYSCKMTMKGNTLDVRGYMGISLIGRTSVWTATE